MTYLSIPNWQKYQHYRDRTPVWVKLHVESINDAKLRSLSLEARLVWHEMLKLAATFQNAVPNSPEVCGNLAGIETGIWREACEELIRKRLLRVKQTRRGASRPASSDASLDKEVRRDKERAREPSAQEQTPCPECDLGGGNHTADCSRRLRVA